MKNYLSAATAVALTIAALSTARAEEATAWRLFVSDHAEGKVTVIDAIDGKVIDTFNIQGPASLYRSDSGETVFAVQGAAGAVTAISTGIAFDDHGDHGDIDVDAPRLTGAEVTGDSPSHFVEHDGEFAAFFDGDGVARVFGESDALKGELEIREVRADAPHHGVVIPFHGHDIVSVPNASDPSEAPVAAKIVGADGKQIGDAVECVGLHGEATSGNLAIIGGCENGIIVIRSEGGAPKMELLAFAEGLPEGKVTTALGGRGMQYFLGNFGPDKVSLIDPTAGKDAFALSTYPCGASTSPLTRYGRNSLTSSLRMASFTRSTW